MVWEFISGAQFTPVVGQYILFAPTLTGVDLIPVYSGVNQVRLADSHRFGCRHEIQKQAGKEISVGVVSGGV